MMRLALAACLGAAGLAAGTPPPYTLERTEVHAVPAPGLGRSYDIYVALPPSYGEDPERRYPVLFTTDAPYAFPVTRAIGARVGDEGRGLDEFIIVGLGYAEGDTPAASRRRDYTPTPNGPSTAPPDAVHGGVEDYRIYLSDTVLPFVADAYRIDEGRMIFAGHSYGALVGLHVLLNAPETFGAYILGSPSLWYDKRVMFRREAEYAATHRDMKAKVFMAIGGYETVKPGSKDPRYNKDLDMVADMALFAAALKGRGYPGLSLTTEVIEGEDHLTVGAVIITHGLIWALRPGR